MLTGVIGRIGSGHTDRTARPTFDTKDRRAMARLSPRFGHDPIGRLQAGDYTLEQPHRNDDGQCHAAVGDRQRDDRDQDL